MTSDEAAKVIREAVKEHGKTRECEMFFSDGQVIERFLDRFESYRRGDEELERFSSGMSAVFPGQWAVVGGAVRDLFFGHSPKDIDVIVDAPVANLEMMLESFKTERNRFGGFKIRGDHEIDVWTVEGMWAVEEGEVEDEGFQTYLDCATYNIDCALVVPDEGEGEVSEMCKGFEDQMISMNSTYHPDLFVAAVRAFRLRHKYQLRLDKGVKDLIREVKEEVGGQFPLQDSF